ncbi:hypothetical protein AWZ03_014961 [Drosophila navojoa]|uniref:Reverse transcriptase/retrotransposon-derived protein RNase H-like domain-containing protein n=1 Tax=Drosophila navojoa TaxID=7232 RepID=A0A484AQB0_DRONA|nr:hypothetical protein AWZ03_014961 [Drosophila navojoa]
MPSPIWTTSSSSAERGTSTWTTYDSQFEDQHQHKVTEDGICTDPEKVAAIAELKPPTTGTKWEWTEERQRAFETVKAKLTESPVLACPDFSKSFHMPAGH